MRKLIFGILSILAATVGMSAYGEEAQEQDGVLPQDSAVDVIAWFNRHDTVTYWVNESQWKIRDSDTVRTASVSMRVRVDVVDSTKNGYKMEYTFLEFPTDTLTGQSALERFQDQIAAKYGQMIVGTTVRFETDEYGRITKYNNLGQIKKQAKSLFKNVVSDLYQLPEVQEMKKAGFDVKDYVKSIDADKLVDGYLEELNMLFLFHGKTLNVGEFTDHEDATDSQFENTSVVSAWIDDDGDAYHIEYDLTSIIPRDDMKVMIGAILGAFSKDVVPEDFDELYDDQVKEDGTYEDYLKTDYLFTGWPYRVVHQNATMIGGAGKVKQTVITMDSYSVGE